MSDAPRPQVMLDGQLVDMTDDQLAVWQVVPPLPPAFTRKVDLWRRTTQQEAADLGAALESAEERMAQIFKGASELHHDQPEWQSLVAIVTGVVGADRAAVILAPSN